MGDRRRSSDRVKARVPVRLRDAGADSVTINMSPAGGSFKVIAQDGGESGARLFGLRAVDCLQVVENDVGLIRAGRPTAAAR